MSDLPPLPADAWPPLPPLADWLDTVETLHRWTQIVGKVRLARTPLENHWWNVPLYVTARGLTTSAVPDGGRHFHIDFDFVDHRLVVGTSDGATESFALGALSVAAFYHALTEALEALGVQLRIWPVPVEIPGSVASFPDDHAHAAYDADAVGRFWRALLQAHRVLTKFRARFLGKVSPVHFFWGGFDLAVTRFSGRAAPQHPGGIPNVGDWVMHEAYSHEVSSAGFWPGVGLGEAAFYAYAYPEPEGFRDAPVEPAAAYFHADLGEFVLPYEAVRTAPDPDAALLAFLQTTYDAGADLAAWDRPALERSAPAPA
ncbi:MAG TPA: DUF5996 family protein [Rhodothermales bacterium]|nr:DUF5996 family protein [Rhodothermales bacterium]